MKTCSKCNRSLPLSEFYKQGGLCRPECKDCRKHYLYKYKRERREQYNAYERRRYARDMEGERKKSQLKYIKNRDAVLDRTKKYKLDNPSINKAHRSVASAVRSGKLTRPSKCSNCGEIKALDAHHDDYSKPLKVRWLCRSCHERKHSSVYIVEAKDGQR